MPIFIPKMQNPLCIYHGNCADGFTAAWIVARALGDSVEFYAADYQKAPPDCKDRDVIIVDFSYKFSVIKDLLRSDDVGQAHTILILDHHKTAQADLSLLKAPPVSPHYPIPYFPEGWRGRWESFSEWPVFAVFDMARSGAQLAWDFFHTGPRPAFVDYVGDRDLAKYELPDSREINAYIFSFPYEFEAWDYLYSQLKDEGNEKGFRTAISGGATLERKHALDINNLLPVVRRTMVIGGHLVSVANMPLTLTHDAGMKMAAEANAPFAGCYWDTHYGRVFSLRSIGDFDVSEVAKRYGGGGHKNAAGFTRPRNWEGDPSP